jgi:hypothetical protein
VNLNLPVEIISIILPFAALFSKPVWSHVQILLVGAILVTGKRTMTSVLAAVGKGSLPIHMITRLRLDAALYQPAPARLPGTMGRPRLKGKRLPNLEKVLVNPNTQWEKITLKRWYGEAERTVEICTGVAVWYHTGLPIVPIRWVLSNSKFKIQNSKWGNSRLAGIVACDYMQIKCVTA